MVFPRGGDFVNVPTRGINYTTHIPRHVQCSELEYFVCCNYFNQYCLKKCRPPWLGGKENVFFTTTPKTAILGTLFLKRKLKFKQWKLSGNQS